MNPCKTCPFIKSSKNFGSIDWIQDVARLLEAGSTNHTCHVTDENADGFKGKNTQRKCDGFKMLFENELAQEQIHDTAYKNFYEFLRAQFKAYRDDGLIDENFWQKIKTGKPKYKTIIKSQRSEN